LLRRKAGAASAAPGSGLPSFVCTDGGGTLWNCSSSVEPVSAVTLELPPWITVVTSSK
jgi:hypothetical protein